MAVQKKRTRLTAKKARKVLTDGKVHGKPLTKKQRSFFAMRTKPQGR